MSIHLVCISQNADNTGYIKREFKQFERHSQINLWIYLVVVLIGIKPHSFRLTLGIMKTQKKTTEQTQNMLNLYNTTQLKYAKNNV